MAPRAAALDGRAGAHWRVRRVAAAIRPSLFGAPRPDGQPLQCRLTAALLYLTVLFSLIYIMAVTVPPLPPRGF